MSYRTFCLKWSQGFDHFDSKLKNSYVFRFSQNISSDFYPFFKWSLMNPECNVHFKVIFLLKLIFSEYADKLILAFYLIRNTKIYKNFLTWGPRDQTLWCIQRYFLILYIENFCTYPMLSEPRQKITFSTFETKPFYIFMDFAPTKTIDF